MYRVIFPTQRALPTHKASKISKTQKGRLSMETGIGDRLARGCPTAQFAGASSEITRLENDVIYLDVDAVLEKYGISQGEYDQYTALRLDGQKLPDLISVALQEKQELGAGFSIADHRRNYLQEATEPAKVVTEQPKRYPEPTYGTARPILDTILVMRIADDPDTELLEDGSTRSKKSGLITAQKYRQHSNVGIVLAAGGSVAIGGISIPMEELIKPGYKVVYGDYNSERFPMDKKKAEALCDAIKVNYVHDPKGLRIIRVQDVRTV